jgi:Fe/S biogenesis protein NfuA
MFTISDEAEIYIAELFKEQGEKDLALKVEVEKVGTPVANVTFNFCRPKELHKKFTKFPYKGFDAYISVSYLGYLKDSDVALKTEGLTKKLTIKAPNAKGDAPGKDAPLKEKIKYTIVTTINPSLASHGGFCELIDVTEKNEVVLNFGGGCQGCSSVAITLKDGIEGQLKALYPEMAGILDYTDHSDKSNAYM